MSEIKIRCMTEEGGCVEIGKHLVVSTHVAGVADKTLPLTYLWITLRDGRKLHVFFNDETNLLVVDVHEKGSSQFGNEIVRRKLPPPITREEKRTLSRVIKESEAHHE